MDPENLGTAPKQEQKEKYDFVTNVLYGKENFITMMQKGGAFAILIDLGKQKIYIDFEHDMIDVFLRKNGIEIDDEDALMGDVKLSANGKVFIGVGFHGQEWTDRFENDEERIIVKDAAVKAIQKIIDEKNN